MAKFDGSEIKRGVHPLTVYVRPQYIRKLPPTSLGSKTPSSRALKTADTYYKQGDCTSIERGCTPNGSQTNDNREENTRICIRRTA